MTRWKSRGTSAIVVTQDDRVTRFADRTLHILDGVFPALYAEPDHGKGSDGTDMVTSQSGPYRSLK